TPSASSTNHEPNLISLKPSRYAQIRICKPAPRRARIVCHLRGEFVAVPRQRFQKMWQARVAAKFWHAATRVLRVKTFSFTSLSPRAARQAAKLRLSTKVAASRLRQPTHRLGSFRCHNPKRVLP